MLHKMSNGTIVLDNIVFVGNWICYSSKDGVEDGYFTVIYYGGKYNFREKEDLEKLLQALEEYHKPGLKPTPGKNVPDFCDHSFTVPKLLVHCLKCDFVVEFLAEPDSITKRCEHLEVDEKCNCIKCGAYVHPVIINPNPIPWKDRPIPWKDRPKCSKCGGYCCNDYECDRNSKAGQL